MKRVYLLLFIIAITIGSNVNAQGVAINTSGADAVASSILDITSTSQGLLIPRMTEVERDAIDTPETGLLIYQTDNNPGFYNYDGTSWEVIGTNSQSIGGLLDARTNGSSIYLGSSTANSTASGNYNFGAGYLSLTNLTSGDENIAIGANTLNSATDEHFNIAIGANALSRISGSGYSHNTAIGVSSQRYSTNGEFNTAIGHKAMEGSSDYSGSLYNTAIGEYALGKINGGDSNVVVGNSAGFNITTGSNNIIIGGNSPEAPSATADNQLNIGNLIYGTGLDGYKTTISSGNIGIGTTSPQDKLHVEGNIRMVDGNQAAGFVMASDVDGTATWTDPSTIGLGGSTSTHGEMAEYNARGSSSPIPITTADTYYGWTSAGSIVQNGTSFVDNGTADRIEVLSAGNYLVQVSVSFGTAGLFPDYIDGAIFVNGSINNNLKFRRYVSAGDIGSASIVGIISLNATDYIDLRFTSNQSGDQVTISICNVTVVKLN